MKMDVAVPFDAEHNARPDDKLGDITEPTINKTADEEEPAVADVVVVEQPEEQEQEQDEEDEEEEEPIASSQEDEPVEQASTVEAEETHEEDEDEEEEEEEVKPEVEQQQQQEAEEEEEEAESCSLLESALKKRTEDEEEEEDESKMHVMEDVKEGCDTQQQPSSPGHAEQGRTEEAQTQSDEKQPKSPADTSVKTQEDFEFHSFEVKQEDEPTVPKSEPSQKRKNVEPEETPQKKQKSELQQEFSLRNKILSEFTDSLDMSNEDQMQQQTEQIMQDIQKLDDLAKEKEREWNNILTVKKMKEELLMRIQRQKQVYLLSNGLEISETDPEDRGNGETRSKLMPKKRQELRHKMRSNYEMNGHDARNNNNGNSNNNGGSNKQRPVRDVQSIIADYRQRHPETVPRRGRRIRSNGHSGSADGSSRISNAGVINFSNVALGSGSQVRQNLNSSIDSNSDIGMLLSAMDAANPDLSSSSNSDAQDNTSFKDILVHFAKMSQSDKQELLQNTMKPPPPYPEVTVHPVSTTTPPTNSLLHGILTKAQSNKTDNKTTFSPTLARLLTAPECSIASQTNQYSPGNKASKVSLSELLCTNKARNEITITPVGNDYESSPKRKHQMEDEEAEDSVDRLVIDESGEIIDRADTNSDNGEDVPQCQGCNQKAAQFVCAGCGNQWYCSRDCQVSAWDEHSEVCSG